MTIVMPRPWLPASALMWFLATVAHAGIPPAVVIDDLASSAAPATGAALPADSAGEEDSAEDAWARGDRHPRPHRHGNDIVSIGHASKLAAGQRGNSVVSIFGSAINDGDAVDVVSILGDTRVTGPVQDSAVSVLGNSYIDAKVDGDVVAVLGNMELGPHADVGGDVITVFGSLKRDPDAIVHGDMQSVMGGEFGGVDWLRAWIDHGLLYGRPLALHRELGWAWGLALIFLALYACIALLFRTGISRCVQTLETYPGHALLAAIVAMLLSPVLLILLFVTVIGIAAVPFVGAAFLCAYLFGKAVTLAWLGGRVIGRPLTGPLSHPAVAVLAGGVLMLALYLIPVVGFLVYHLIGVFGFGAVVYTLVLATREHQAAKQGAQARNGARGPDAAPGLSAAAAGAAIDGGPGTTFSAGSPPGAAGSGSAADQTAPAPQAPAASVSASLPRAGFWIRMGALLLDVILVGFVAGMLHHVFHYHLAILALYAAVMWKLRGSTIGGIVFDLKVVRLDGRAMDWETAIVRALACFLSLAVAGLGFIWIAIDDAHQAWHDKIAGTVVVRIPKPVPAAV
jgi:uncharacterized RDD family membrane protein YckC